MKNAENIKMPFFEFWATRTQIIHLDRLALIGCLVWSSIATVPYWLSFSPIFIMMCLSFERFSESQWIWDIAAVDSFMDWPISTIIHPFHSGPACMSLYNGWFDWYVSLLSLSGPAHNTPVLCQELISSKRVVVSNRLIHLDRLALIGCLLWFGLPLPLFLIDSASAPFSLWCASLLRGFLSHSGYETLQQSIPLWIDPFRLSSTHFTRVLHACLCTMVDLIGMSACWALAGQHTTLRCCVRN